MEQIMPSKSNLDASKLSNKKVKSESKHIAKNDITISDTAVTDNAVSRFNKVIIKYFDSQKEVADLVGITPANMSSYTSGKYNLTLKFAMRLQDKAGINATYIMEGGDDSTMMIDSRREPKLKGDIPYFSKLDTKTQQSGITKHFILQYEGNRQSLKPNGDASVVNLVLGSIEDTQFSFQVFNGLPEFEVNYNIPVNATIILKKDYQDNDLVLYHNGFEYGIGVFYDNKITEMNSQKTYNIVDDIIKIKGRVIGKFENIRYKKH